MEDFQAGFMIIYVPCLQQSEIAKKLQSLYQQLGNQYIQKKASPKFYEILIPTISYERDLLTNKIEDKNCSKPYFKAYHSFADVRLQLYCLSLTFNLETFFRFHLEFFHRLLPATRLPYSTKIRKPVSIKTISDNLSSLLHLHFNFSSLSPSSSNPFRVQFWWLPWFTDRRNNVTTHSYSWF